MTLNGIRFLALLNIYSTSFILGYQATEPNEDGICFRDRGEIKTRLNSNITILPKPVHGYEDTIFMNLLEQSAIFIDRSLLIKRILETKEKVILITSPPGTGKSINLSMLKAFFEIRLEKQDMANPPARTYPRNETSTYKFFTTGYLNTTTDSPLQCMSRLSGTTDMVNLATTATYLTPPFISSHRDIVDDHLARYPVIYMEFYSVFFKVSNITDSLRLHVCDLYNRHRSLRGLIWQVILDPSTASERRQKTRVNLKDFLFYTHRCFYGKPFSAAELETSVLTLSKILHQLFNKPVIILIDEYVKTLQYYLFEKDQREKTEDDAAQCIQLLRNFMKKTFAKNRHFKKAIITGTLSINKKDLFADVDDYVHYNAVRNDLQEFYGLSREDVKTLAFYYRRSNSRVGRKSLHFYKGYAVKPNINLTLYNTWAIVNAFNTNKLGKFWVYHNETFAKLVDWLDIVKLRKVMKLKSVLTKDDIPMSFTEIDFSIKEMVLSTKYIYTEEKINRVLSLLYEMGFLAINPYAPNSLENDNNIRVRIASDEVRCGLKRLYMHRSY